MPFSQISLAKYHYYRLALAVAIGLLTLILTLSIRIYEQTRVINQDQQRIARHTIQKLEALLQPANSVPFAPLIQPGQNCLSQQPALQRMVSLLQTLRAIALVRDDQILCSSLIGSVSYDFNQLLPQLALGASHLQLRTSTHGADSIPTLVLWRPDGPDKDNGLLFVYNIGVLTNFLLEPQPPYAQSIVLNVLDKSLEYGKNQITPRVDMTQNPIVFIRSGIYDFSVSIYGDDAATLAWSELLTHLPLSLLISLLTAFAIYLLSGSRISLAYPISQAISHREFQVYCQPIINSADGRCVGIETLMRWKNHRQEWISPDVFIPLAEQHGLIIPLTRYLIKQVVEKLALFPARSDFYISINVAAQHFNDMVIVDDIRQLWLSAEPRLSLMLELTERTHLQELTTEQISELKEMGIMLAIDDFGTGHSSLSYLKTLTPDVLKIDQAFTASIGTDAINATVTDTIITLAQRLKVKLIAEGVETLEQADYMRKRKVDALQGYYFSRPMPIDIFPSWLEHYEKDEMNAFSPVI